MQIITPHPELKPDDIIFAHKENTRIGRIALVTIGRNKLAETQI